MGGMYPAEPWKFHPAELPLRAKEGHEPQPAPLPLATLPTGANCPGQLVTWTFCHAAMNRALKRQFDGF